MLTRPVEHTSAAIGPARRWVDDVLESCDVSPAVRRVAMLLTSEILTNAVQHGTAPVRAVLEVGHRVVRVGVEDGSTALPRLRSPRPEETGGRGVQFLERCASRWGVDLHDDPAAGSAADSGVAGGGAADGGAADGGAADGGAADGRAADGRAAKTVWFELDLDD